MKNSTSNKQLDSENVKLSQSFVKANIQAWSKNEPSSPKLNSSISKQNDLLKMVNQQLKDKLMKMSQALDLALINQKNNNTNSSPVIQKEPSQLQLQPQVREATLNLLKMKEKEIGTYIQTIAALKKENHTLKNKLEHKEGFHRMVELEDKLKETERRNQELQREVKSLQRIQLDQGKALERITNENDYPSKIKTLVEELRVAKDKIRELEEKSRKDEKHSLQVQEYMVKLEECCRDLKAKLKAKSALNQSTAGDITIEKVENTGVDPQKMEELQKANKILMRAKEVQFKKGQYLKAKFEKKMTKINAQMEQLQQQIADKDKEIKLYQMKLSEFVKTNLNNITSEKYLEIENMMTPKPLAASSGRMTDQYNKMKEITHKYGKLPLKPGFQGAGRSIRLQHLSIDVNGNDYMSNTNTNNTTIDGIIQNNNSNRNIHGLSNSKSTQNRSKSIDPTQKRLARIPETTRKNKIKQLINAQEDNQEKIEIVIAKEEIQNIEKLRVPQTDKKEISEDYLIQKERDLERETKELLEKIKNEAQDHYETTDAILNDGFNYDFGELNGDISKLNNDIIDEYE